MKKIILLLCLIIFIISLTGCAKVIKTEEQNVKVKIVNVNHSPSRLYMVGKVPIHILQSMKLQLNMKKKLIHLIMIIYIKNIKIRLEKI